MARASPRVASTKTKRTVGRITDRPIHHRELDVEKGTLFSPRDARKVNRIRKNIKNSIDDLVPRLNGKKLSTPSVSSSGTDFEGSYQESSFDEDVDEQPQHEDSDSHRSLQLPSGAFRSNEGGPTANIIDGEESEDTFMSAPGNTALQHPEDTEPAATPRSAIEVEHDLFNSVIDKDQGKKAKSVSPPTSPSPSVNSNGRREIEPTPGPSNTPHAHRERPSENGSPATSHHHDSGDSAKTVRGADAKVKHSPKRKRVVEEDDPMDDGELADSESDINAEEESLDEQISRAVKRLGKRDESANLKVPDIIPLYTILGKFMNIVLNRNMAVPVAQNGAGESEDILRGENPRRPRRLQQKMTTQAVKRLRRDVRNLTMELMNRDTNKDPFPLPPTKGEVDKFQKTSRDGPRGQPLNLDVTGYKMRSRWNQEGALIVAREYVGREYCICKKVQVVQSFVLRHIPALVRQYTMLSSENSNSVIRAKVDQQAERDSRNSRRKGLGLRRLSTALHDPDMEKFGRLIDTLGTGGISGDETDTGKNARRHSDQPRYKIVNLEWRSKKLTRVLRTLDLLHLAKRRFSNNGRATSGAWPRIRIESHLKDESPAVRGLPRNCYSKEWLSLQDERTKIALDAQKKVSLKIPKSVLEEASRFKHVKGPKDEPRPPKGRREPLHTETRE